MNTDPTAYSAAAAPHSLAIRALYAGPAYWFAMFAASALGTNLGDFWAEGLFQDRLASFASLAVICAVAVWADRRIADRSEAAYWLAIVALRAAASNVGDYLTHDLALGYGLVTILCGIIALVAARFTRPDPVRGNAPRIDGYYWIAMLLAGLFGTVGGDLGSHSFGLYAASGAFCTILIALIVARSRLAPASILLYWCIVLAERCAGTAVGDGVASHRGLGLGLPAAMACTFALLVVALVARAQSRRALAT